MCKFFFYISCVVFFVVHLRHVVLRVIRLIVRIMSLRYDARTDFVGCVRMSHSIVHAFSHFIKKKK